MPEAGRLAATTTEEPRPTRPPWRGAASHVQEAPFRAGAGRLVRRCSARPGQPPPPPPSSPHHWNDTPARSGRDLGLGKDSPIPPSRCKPRRPAAPVQPPGLAGIPSSVPLPASERGGEKMRRRSAATGSHPLGCIRPHQPPVPPRRARLRHARRRAQFTHGRRGRRRTGGRRGGFRRGRPWCRRRACPP